MKTRRIMIRSIRTLPNGAAAGQGKMFMVFLEPLISSPPQLSVAGIKNNFKKTCSNSSSAQYTSGSQNQCHHVCYRLSKYSCPPFPLTGLAGAGHLGETELFIHCFCTSSLLYQQVGRK